MKEEKNFKITKKERKRRSEHMADVQKIGVTKRKEEAEKAELALMGEDNMPILHRTFAELYLYDPEHRGNATASYKTAFNTDAKDAGFKGRKLLTRPHVAEYIDKMVAENTLLMKAEAIRNTQTLIAIRDEMSTIKLKDRKGTELNPASARNVALRAVEGINDMMGFNKAKDVNLKLDENTGFNFNLIVPTPEPKVVDITENQ